MATSRHRQQAELHDEALARRAHVPDRLRRRRARGRSRRLRDRVQVAGRQALHGAAQPPRLRLRRADLPGRDRRPLVPVEEGAVPEVPLGPLPVRAEAGPLHLSRHEDAHAERRCPQGRCLDHAADLARPGDLRRLRRRRLHPRLRVVAGVSRQVSRGLRPRRDRQDHHPVARRRWPGLRQAAGRHLPLDGLRGRRPDLRPARRGRGRPGDHARRLCLRPQRARSRRPARAARAAAANHRRRLEREEGRRRHRPRRGAQQRERGGVAAGGHRRRRPCAAHTSAAAASQVFIASRDGVPFKVLAAPPTSASAPLHPVEQRAGVRRRRIAGSSAASRRRSQPGGSSSSSAKSGSSRRPTPRRCGSRVLSPHLILAAANRCAARSSRRAFGVYAAPS